MQCYECEKAKREKKCHIFCSVDKRVYHENHLCHITPENLANDIYPYYGRLVMRLAELNNAIINRFDPSVVLNIVDNMSSDVRNMQEYLYKKVER